MFKAQLLKLFFRTLCLFWKQLFGSGFACETDDVNEKFQDYRCRESEKASDDSRIEKQLGELIRCQNDIH